MQTNIIVRLQIEGLHRWPDAAKVFPEVSFLSDPHRHIFHIECRKEVFHDDRDSEFIMFKRDVREHFVKYFNADLRLFDFDTMSCEMIARELLEKFECVYVSVFEDNENGAEVIA